MLVIWRLIMLLGDLGRRRATQARSCTTLTHTHRAHNTPPPGPFPARPHVRSLPLVHSYCTRAAFSLLHRWNGRSKGEGNTRSLNPGTKQEEKARNPLSQSTPQRSSSKKKKYARAGLNAMFCVGRGRWRGGVERNGGTSKRSNNTRDEKTRKHRNAASHVLA